MQARLEKAQHYGWAKSFIILFKKYLSLVTLCFFSIPLRFFSNFVKESPPYTSI